MSWLLLMVAIVFEVAGTTCMKLSEGMTKILPTVLMLTLYVASFSLMAISLKGISVGTAYAVWSGLGTALVAMIGIVWFAEPVGTLKFVSLGLVIAGVVGLRLAAGGE